MSKHYVFENADDFLDFINNTIMVTTFPKLHGNFRYITNLQHNSFHCRLKVTVGDILISDSPLYPSMYLMKNWLTNNNLNGSSEIVSYNALNFFMNKAMSEFINELSNYNGNKLKIEFDIIKHENHEIIINLGQYKTKRMPRKTPTTKFVRKDKL